MEIKLYGYVFNELDVYETAVLRWKRIVKINISIEGEDLESIISELISIGTELIKSNRDDLKESMEVLADEAIDVLMKHKILEKGAKLYKEINSEINYAYKKQKNQ